MRYIFILILLTSSFALADNAKNYCEEYLQTGRFSLDKLYKERFKPKNLKIEQKFITQKRRLKIFPTKKQYHLYSFDENNQFLINRVLINNTTKPDLTYEVESNGNTQVQTITERRYSKKKKNQNGEKKLIFTSKTTFETENGRLKKMTFQTPLSSLRYVTTFKYYGETCVPLQRVTIDGNKSEEEKVDYDFNIEMCRDMDALLARKLKAKEKKDVTSQLTDELKKILTQSYNAKPSVLSNPLRPTSYYTGKGSIPLRGHNWRFDQIPTPDQDAYNILSACEKEVSVRNALSDRTIWTSPAATEAYTSTGNAK